MIALSPNSNEIRIYATNKQNGDSSKWTRKFVLDEVCILKHKIQLYTITNSAESVASRIFHRSSHND